MTVGEKILYYRKAAGLSQEELGQRLLVSRQTVSLWEMDKTLPTIDNLMRLAEIFSITTDDILGAGEPAVETPPEESYEWQFNESEVRELYIKQYLRVLRRFASFTLFFIVLLGISLAFDIGDLACGLLFGVLTVGAVMHVKDIVAFCRSYRTIGKTITECIYSYEVQDGYFDATISSGGDVKKRSRIRAEDITDTVIYGRYLFLCTGGQSFIIKMDAIPPQSLFYSIHRQCTARKTAVPLSGKLKAISVILIICSAAAFLAAAYTAYTTASFGLISFDVFLYFLPVPLAAAIFGHCLKKRGYKGDAVFAVGAGIAAFMCLYGFIGSMGMPPISHSDEPIIEVEELLDIDIPEHLDVETIEHNTRPQSYPEEYVYYTSYVYLGAEEAEELETTLAADARWLAGIPEELVCIASQMFYYDSEDLQLIYNIDTKKYNSLPLESGRYELIQLRYEAEFDRLRIIRYSTKYVK